MTAFSEADLDRLADFVGGALDGTPEADDVRHLVSTDTSWAEAYAMLVTADAAMRDELHALGAEAPAVPLDVQQRLDAALAGASTAPPADAPVVDLARAREARRRRRARWTIGLATAAAVIVCGGVGVQAIRTGTASLDSTTSAVPDRADAPDGGQTRSSSGAGGYMAGNSPVISSGRDYGRGQLGQLAGGQPGPDVRNSGKSDVRGEGAAGTASIEAGAPTGVPSPLARLSAPAARAACLTAITKEYGGQVSLVDYAAFEGQAALVVVVDGTRVGGGKRLIVVVGPDCGVGGAIADERYRTTAP
ncbi:hypothetical protein ABT297_08230 [Dactylosporangium sp. NPDC000555]|uniref:hypothetical protein n=1 Tax=Dactylosporangium sp. NPDC000555 TaxID=3154260 RepID=UPI00333425D6